MEADETSTARSQLPDDEEGDNLNNDNKKSWAGWMTSRLKCVPSPAICSTKGTFSVFNFGAGA
jgi:hypothetical protein